MRAPGDNPQSRNDAQTHEQGGDIMSEAFTAGAEVNAAGALRTGSSSRNGTVGCPKVAKKQLDLRIGQLKHSRWQALFVRPLAKDSKVAQPAIHTRVMPPIPVAGNHQLMPLTASSVAGTFPSKRFGRFGHCPAVVLRC